MKVIAVLAVLASTALAMPSLLAKQYYDDIDYCGPSEPGYSCPESCVCQQSVSPDGATYYVCTDKTSGYLCEGWGYGWYNKRDQGLEGRDITEGKAL